MLIILTNVSGMVIIVGIVWYRDMALMSTVQMTVTVNKKKITHVYMAIK